MDIAHFTGSSRLTEPPRSVDLVRLGLVAGAVLAASFGFGALVFVLEPDSGQQETLPAEQSVSSRLPRPRPSEPATTGSIGPVRNVALDLASAIASGRDRAQAHEDLRGKAMLAASISTECDEVVGSEVLEIRSNPENPLVVWVQCGNGTRFYLDRARLEGEATAQPALPRPLDLSDTEAVRACEDKVRLGLPVPASLARLLSTTWIDRAPGNDPVVTFDLDALNGLGFPLALRVQCVFDDHRIARLHVDPR